MAAPRITTPVGSAAAGAAVATISFWLLSLWPAWHHAPLEVQGATETLIGAGTTYMAGWLKVVLTPGQKAAMELTSGPLPTLQPSQPLQRVLSAAADLPSPVQPWTGPVPDELTQRLRAELDGAFSSPGRHDLRAPGASPAAGPSTSPPEEQLPLPPHSGSS